MRSSVRWFGVISVSAVLLACGSESPTGAAIGGASGSSDNGDGVGGGDGGTSGSSGAGAPNTSGSGGSFDWVEPLPDGGVDCRTQDSCDPLECGPIADGCGSFIECGGCEAPATCGGAGVPSRCGVPGSGGSGGGETCEPSTCESLGVACGQHGDGCGGVITCSPCAGAGQECVQGQCVDTVACEPLTCDDYSEPGRCGPVSDGCSGILNCPFTPCAGDEMCGAVTPGFCGTATCEPFETCEEALAGKPDGFCGFVSNGCDGEMVGCATVCSGGESCGVTQGGSFVEICGSESGGCTPVDQAVACAGKCGVVSNGCSSTYSCGGCTGNEVCGAGGPNVCGQVACVPTTCDAVGAECGSVDDGCGEQLDCGSCGGGETCAGGGVAYECGAPACEPLTPTAACAAANANCGLQSDGCSGTVSCGTCSGAETCGGGGTPNRCGTSCTPLTCADLGATCGPQGNGCGGQLDCGSCDAGEVCQGTPSACVPEVPCTNFCEQQATCAPGEETTIRGTVYAPNGSEPLYNALVYVPNLADLNDLPAISTGPSCDRCEDEDLGDPLVATITGPDGSFTLENVPSGVDFPLVVKMGKWRRVTMIPAVADCSDNVLSADDARLARHRNDAAAGLTQHINIPRFAIATGWVDAIECVMRKIGIADSEFTAPSGNGRIHLYRGYRGAGTSRDSNGNVIGTSASQLFDSNTPSTDIDNYDVAVFDCEGTPRDHDSRHAGLHDFANAGGRVFASHYSYTYLEGNSSFDAVATWGGSQGAEANAANPTTGIIDTSHSKGQAFNSWLGLTDSHHETYGDGYISITDPRGYVTAVDPATTERFVHTDEDHIVPGYSGTGDQPNGDINVGTAVQQFSFNTPVGAAPEASCGRVLYSAFHVAGQTDTRYYVFPEHCDDGPLTPQEKVLEFMIFDLSACVSTSVPPSCVPRTCEDVGANCGYLSDGCGGLLSCGTCTSPESCGGGGTPNVCGSSCTLTSCAAEGATCGTIGDGCGGTLDCGDCTSPALCGGGGTANVCGTPACTPRSCASAGATCGTIGDGCGGSLDCGSCPQGQFCGGGGPNTCGTGSCTPTTCAAANAECGTLGDGCGNALECGTCPQGSVCGAGGPNRCGPVCTPRTCASVGANCGFIGDGCGGVLNCGTCSEGAVCGGGGVANVCGAGCDPYSCAELNAECGTISDGCGGILSCGTCPQGQVCGASVSNQCGQGSCTKVTCGAEDCGIISDGCSGTIDCGPCQGCVPFSCVSGVDCGPVADGCGALIDCGVCVNGNTCGGGGQASKCGGGIQ